MLVNLTTSATYEGLFGDPELAALLDGKSEIGAMLEVERALARVQGRLGVIPEAAAEGIDEHLACIDLEPEDLRQRTAADGVPVPALLDIVRACIPEDAADWLHWGATSQDIADTAMVLQLRACLDLLEGRLAGVIDDLKAKSHTHEDLVMAARTRGQVATPITFGLKLARWAQPLIDAEAALPAVRVHALRVQFGGAAGANTAIAPYGPSISETLAAELDLADSPPWHTARGGILEAAGWLASVVAGLSKFGSDLILLGRSEIGEVRAGDGGGSSTMPQKANPVAAEAVFTLGRLATSLHGGLLAAAAPAEERDGAAWALEWILLPQLLLACGAALRHARALADSLIPNPEAMRRTLDAQPGSMAEAASFALARECSRSEAKALVRAALSAPEGFAAALAEKVPAVDWDSVLDPASVVPASHAEAERIWATRR
ncbi:lyase family protein [Tropicimonas isoalkanivorans]|uniref:3-carboxy-cis,cis-muconate cycloisomerase n=1 Tax=Tropicimonas isoalkanivorans TaxID=441112 RepID=A0A1I1PIU5_9RHOB|nr:lyase family protein [Tropicimonas isoalkanivorans]SFD09739.1 3-carboxy-cis,cis-muconate cycloisomerase [Tropicimonas isoalkanivorans]